MEKDLNRSEKKTTDDDDDDSLISNSSSKNYKTSGSDESTKKHDRPASFFVASKDSETIQNKKIEETDSKNVEKTESQNLTEDEVHEVVQIIIDERENYIASELASTNDGSSEELQAVAAGLFLESLRHKALGENEVTPDSIKKAYEESIEDLEITIDIDDLNEIGVDEQESSINPINPISNSNGNVSLPTANNSPNTTTPQFSPTSPQNNLMRPGGTTNNPPSTTVTRQSYQQQNNQNRNYVPVPIPVPLDSGAALLAGTITGYIVGRRSKKRIESSNSSTPINKKLENQVKQLQKAIYTKESKLRDEVRKFRENTQDISDNSVLIVERRKKRIELREELKRREELIKNPKVEKIGNFSLPALKIYRERRLPDGSENHPKRKPVEIMTVAELLEKSGHVKYEKWRIDELYRAHRISEKVLRQVTKEYMRGGPYKQTLAREVLPDPKIVADKQNNIELLHQKISSENGNNRIKETSIDSNEINVSSKLNNSKANNKQSQKQNSELPLPWIAAVTAIATLIALTLIYVG